MIADLLGVPRERREDFLRWGAAAAATLDPGLPFRRFATAQRALRATVLLLLGAGFETTVNLLGNAVVLLDAHRDQWEALRADPSGKPSPV